MAVFAGLPLDDFADQKLLKMVTAVHALAATYGASSLSETTIIDRLVAICLREVEICMERPDYTGVIDGEPVYCIRAHDFMLTIPRAQVHVAAGATCTLARFVKTFPELFLSNSDVCFEVIQRLSPYGFLSVLQLPLMKLIRALIRHAVPLGIPLERFLTWPAVVNPEAVTAIARCLALLVRTQSFTAELATPVLEECALLMGGSIQRQDELAAVNDGDGVVREVRCQIEVAKVIARVTAAFGCPPEIQQDLTEWFPYGENDANRAAQMRLWTGFALAQLSDPQSVAALCIARLSDPIAPYRIEAVKCTARLAIAFPEFETQCLTGLIAILQDPNAGRAIHEQSAVSLGPFLPQLNDHFLSLWLQVLPLRKHPRRLQLHSLFAELLQRSDSPTFASAETSRIVAELYDSEDADDATKLSFAHWLPPAS
jgi:hypothetical protein